MSKLSQEHLITVAINIATYLIIGNTIEFFITNNIDITTTMAISENITNACTVTITITVTIFVAISIAISIDMNIFMAINISISTDVSITVVTLNPMSLLISTAFVFIMTNIITPRTAITLNFTIAIVIIIIIDLIIIADTIT